MTGTVRPTVGDRPYTLVIVAPGCEIPVGGFATVEAADAFADDYRM